LAAVYGHLILDDRCVLPVGKCLEKLKADQEGQRGIRINDQSHISFYWADDGAENVKKSPAGTEEAPAEDEIASLLCLWFLYCHFVYNCCYAMNIGYKFGNKSFSGFVRRNSCDSDLAVACHHPGVKSAG